MTRRESLVALCRTLWAVSPDRVPSGTAADGGASSIAQAEAGRLYREGSYHKLNTLLDQLRDERPVQHRHLWEHYIAGNGHGARKRRADSGLAWLDQHWPGDVIVPALFRELWHDGNHLEGFTPGWRPEPKGRDGNHFNRKRRDEKIRILVAEGHTQREVAKLCGISQPAVWKALRRVTSNG